MVKAQSEQNRTEREQNRERENRTESRMVNSTPTNGQSLNCPVCMVSLKPNEVNAHFYKEVHEMETYRNALR